MDSDPLNLSRCRDKFDRHRLLQVLKQLVAMRNNLNSEDPVLVLLDRLSLVVIDCLYSRALEKLTVVEAPTPATTSNYVDETRPSVKSYF